MQNTIAIARREFVSFFNSPIAYLVCTVYLVLSGWILFFSDLFLGGQADMRSFFGLAPLLFFIITPFLTMRLLAEEKHQGTLELLLTWPVTDWQVVIGKYLAVVGLILVLLFLTLAFPFSVASLGPLDKGATTAGYIGLVLMTGTYAAIGLMASSFTHNQIVAALIALFIGFGLFIIGQMVQILPPSIAPIANAVSIQTRFLSIARGVIDSRDVIYYLSVIFGCLLVAVTVLQSREVALMSGSRDSRNLNKAQTGANAIIFVAAVLLGLVFFNLIANRFFKRADLTADKIYTLSQPSRDLVRNLPDKITAKAFISKDLQPPFSQVGQYVRDMLDEYAAASKGKFKWEAIDPGSDPKLEEEANKYHVPKMRRGRYTSNKVEIGSSYLGLALDYQGNIESFPEISSPEGLEYQIDSRIKLMTGHKKKIAFATSEGEMSPDAEGPHGGLQMLKQVAREYDFATVQLGTGPKPIADDIDALVVAGPHLPMSDRSKFVLDQFLMHGKSVAFLVDGMTIESPQGMGMPPGQDGPKIGKKNEGAEALEDLLGFYGFKVHDDLILEPRQNVPGLLTVQGRQLLANYPTFVVSTKLAENSPVSKGIQAVVLPFTSSLEALSGKQPGLEVTPLATSTADAWRQTGFFVFDPVNVELKQGTERGPFTFAMAAKGKLKSFFAGKEYPNESGQKVSAPPADASLPPGTERPLDESTGPVRMVVVADSQFAADENLRFAQQLPAYGHTLLFAMNMIDYLAQDEALSQIRAKGVPGRPLTYSSESAPEVVKYANVVGVPLAFILFGLVRWRLRTSRRRAAKL